jgi:hypothetical protein
MVHAARKTTKYHVFASGRNLSDLGVWGVVYPTTHDTDFTTQFVDKVCYECEMLAYVVLLIYAVCFESIMCQLP